MRALTVDCVTFILRAASMKLPVSATIRNVRARAMSISNIFHSLPMPKSIYRKLPIGVSGKIRL